MTDFYFDFSATFDGDGTAPAQAASGGGVGARNTFDGVGLLAFDKCWIRRSGVADAPSGQITLNIDNAFIIGWPIAGDAHYSLRPVAGTSEGWDADVATHAEIAFTSGTYGFLLNGDHGYMGRMNVTQLLTYTIRLATCWSWRFENFDIDNPVGTTPNNRGIQIVTGGGHIFRNCRFAGTPGANIYSLLYISGDGCFFYDTTIEFGKTYSAVTGAVMEITGAKNHMYNTTVVTNETSTYYVLNLSTASESNVIVDMTVSFNPASTTNKLYIAGKHNKVKNLNVLSGGFNLVSLLSDYSEIEINNLVSAGVVASPVKITGKYNKITLDGYISNETTSGISFISGVDNLVILKDYTFDTAAASMATNTRNVMYSLNHGGTAGFWTMITNAGKVESSSTVRTGGGAFSLRCELSASSAFEQGGLLIGGLRSEIIYASLVTGVNTISFFGAHKLFTNPLDILSVIIEVDYLDANGHLTTVTSTGTNGAFIVDSSVWTGDTGLTKFKVSTEATLPSDQVCAVRIRYSPVVDGVAYAYIDPDPVIT